MLVEKAERLKIVATYGLQYGPSSPKTTHTQNKVDVGLNGSMHANKSNTTLPPFP
jgi:hypothetical protein